MLHSSSIRVVTPEDSESASAWQLAGLCLDLLEAGATREVRLRSALLLAQCLVGRSAVERAVRSHFPQRLVTTLGREPDADVRLVTVAALVCLSGRAEGAAALALLPDTLSVLVTCVSKSPAALIPLSDVAASTAGASAVLAAGAVRAAIAFLDSPDPGAAIDLVANAAKGVAYPVLIGRSPVDDGLAIIRTIAEHDPGRDAVIACRGSRTILAYTHSSKEPTTLSTALGAVAALAGSVAGLASLLQVSGSQGAVPSVIAHLEASDARVSALAFLAAQQLAVSPVGRRQLCEALVGRPPLLLRVFPPPSAAALTELVALLCSTSTLPTHIAGAISLLCKITDPKMLLAGSDAAKSALDAMARASFTLRLTELSRPGSLGPASSDYVAAEAARLLDLVTSSLRTVATGT